MSGGSGVPVDISSAFDAGNIEVVDASSSSNVRVNVRDDPYTELEKTKHKQWFYFRASGALSGRDCRFSIANAGKCAYAFAFRGYTVCYSYDRHDWRRCTDTKYDTEKGSLDWGLKAEQDVVYFAYFAPYSHERHEDLVAACSAAEGASVRSIGKTLDGRSMDLVTVGTGPLKAWVIHRQHPGESMAEWFAEGLLHRLIGFGEGRDGLVRQLLSKVTFHIVPSMNPDGAFRGHLRTNAAGANLNREWASTGDYQAPTLERSPEVFHVLREMDSIGVDFFIDVHGDEGLPYNFLAGAEGCPNWGPRMEALQGLFTRAYERANPDMQCKYAYEPDPPKGANLAICSNQIAARFDCLAVTLEMPFKDCKTNPDPVAGWSPARAQQLGRSLLDAVAYSLPYLRAKEPFWEGLAATDLYICPVKSEAEGESG